MLEHFKSATVTLPAPEIYTAMERGVVDGFAFPADETIPNMALNEVTKYFITHGFGTNPVTFFMNLEKWNSLSDEQRKLMLDTAKDIEIEWAPIRWKAHEEVLDWYRELGMEEMKFEGDAGKRLVQAFNDSNWADIIEKSPEYGPKLRALSGN